MNHHKTMCCTRSRSIAPRSRSDLEVKCQKIGASFSLRGRLKGSYHYSNLKFGMRIYVCGNNRNLLDVCPNYTDAPRLDLG